MPRANSTVIHKKWATSFPYHCNTLLSWYICTGETINSFGEVTFNYRLGGSIEGYAEPSKDEVRRSDNTLVTQPYTMYVPGYFEIGAKDKLVIDGLEHQILKVTHDDFKSITYVTTEVINAE